MTLSSRDALRLLKAAGWYEHSQQGSHLHLKHPTRPEKLTLPHPRKDLSHVVVKSLERMSGIKLK